MIDPSRLQELNGEAQHKLVEKMSAQVQQQEKEIEKLEAEWEKVKRQRFRNTVIASIIGAIFGTIIFRLFF